MSGDSGNVTNSQGQHSNRVRIRAIRPFTGTMNPQYVASIWDFLRNSIIQILNKNSSGLSFEELYRNAYTMVLHKHGDMLYSGIRETISEYLTTKVRQEILKSLDSQNQLLTIIKSVWQEHETSMIMIRDILMYMDRVYINSKPELENVYRLGLSLFREKIIQSKPIDEAIFSQMLSVVSRDRNAELVDRATMKCLCLMLDKLSPSGEPFKTYRDVFERNFLHHTAQYYNSKSSSLLETRDACYYLEQTEILLNRESERTEEMLLICTRDPLTDTITGEMLTKRFSDILDMESSGINNMLLFNKINDISRAYRLFSADEECLKNLADRVASFVLTHGQSLCCRNSDGKTPNELSGIERIRQSVELVDNLLKLRSDFDILLKTAFQNDALYKSKISGAFENILNNGGNFGPECLAIYFDHHLRKGSKSGDERLIHLVNKVMVLFRYLMEKDAFERYYKHYLSYRLLSNRTSDTEYEKYVLSRLKTECGANFTIKLEGMFRDMQVSTQMNETFKQHYTNLPINFNCLVLTTGYWPNMPCDLSINYPSEVSDTFDTFVEFYAGRHNGRQLKLVPQFCTFELFFKPYLSSDQSTSNAGASSRKYILLVNPAQMAILYSFNYTETHTVQSLCDQTNLSSDELKYYLRGLIVAPCPTNSSSGEGNNVLVCKDSTYKVNTEFRSKQVRLKLSGYSPVGRNDLRAASIPTAQQQHELQNRILEDRRHEIDASIVRVMKARQTIHHTLLIQEVTDQLKNRFNPDIAMIKQRIQHLVEREYICRNSDDRKLYQYIA